MNSVISRVLIFYVGSVLLVVCLVPWNSSQIATPYVSALNVMGIPAAAQIMNAVVLTAVLSALNSGLYASSRMLFALTERGDAPRFLARLSSNGVPRRAILLGTVFGYAAVIMSYVSPDAIFAFLVNSYGTVAIFVYLFIASSQLRLRARLEAEQPGTAATAHVVLSVPDVSGYCGHARHPGRHGLHSRSTHAADLRAHQFGGVAARLYACAPGLASQPANRQAGLRWHRCRIRARFRPTGSRQLSAAARSDRSQAAASDASGSASVSSDNAGVSRVLLSLMLSRSSLAESALRMASSYEMAPSL